MSFADFRKKMEASAPDVAAATGAVDRVDPGPSCRDCLAFQVDGESRETGECRRYAPRPGVGEAFAWPVVDGDDWCVQHRSSAPPFQLTFVASSAPVDTKAADDD